MKFNKKNTASAALSALVMAQPVTSMIIPYTSSIEHVQSLLSLASPLNVLNSAFDSFNADWFKWGSSDKTPEPAFEYDESERVLETEQGVYLFGDEKLKSELMRKGVGFMDVTDHIEFYAELDKQKELAQASLSEDEDPAPHFPLELSHSEKIKSIFPDLSQDYMRDVLTQYSTFHTRYYRTEYGLNASLWLAEQVREVALKGEKDGKPRHDISVEIYDHKGWPQKSIIATIPGKNATDQHMPYNANGDVVVISAHLDSVNMFGFSTLRSPGADDNGSGCVTVLDVFRTLVANGFQPENTYQFHWYSAEEPGLLGSQDVMTEYKSSGVTVRAMLNFDMTGYLGVGITDHTKAKFGIFVDQVDPHLTDFLELLVEEHTDIPFEHCTCGFGCSDHVSAFRVGYPSAFLFEANFLNKNPYVHTFFDSIEKLSFAHMEKHARVALAFAYELAEYDFVHLA